MNTLHVEFLMNHKLGLAQSYMKPTEQQLLEDYLKAVPALTINYDKDKTVLQKQVAELAEKEKETKEQTQKELEELRKEVKSMKSSYRTMVECGVFDSDISDGSPLPIRPVNEDMRVAVAERKAELLQYEIDRLKELMAWPFFEEGKEKKEEE